MITIYLLSLLFIGFYYVFIREDQIKRELILDPIDILDREYQIVAGRVLFCLSFGFFIGNFLLYFVTLIDFFY